MESSLALTGLVIAAVLALLVVRLIRHLYRLRQALSCCPACGAHLLVRPDPGRALLVARCLESHCGHGFTHAVRPSGLSLFGVAQLGLTLLTAVACLCGARGGGAATLPVALAAAAAGAIAARFLVRLVAFTMLQRELSPFWQSEIVAHLAPPPWLVQGPPAEGESGKAS
jgi:hypothetical protein